jgi:hypothetical protein
MLPGAVGVIAVLSVAVEGIESWPAQVMPFLAGAAQASPARTHAASIFDALFVFVLAPVLPRFGFSAPAPAAAACHGRHRAG